MSSAALAGPQDIRRTWDPPLAGEGQPSPRHMGTGGVRVPTDATEIREQVARRTAVGLASKSVRERVSVLRQVIDFAEVNPNPARHRSVKLPARPERELVVPSAGEVLALAGGLSNKYKL